MKTLDELELSFLAAARRGLTPEASTGTRVRAKALSAIAAGVAIPGLEPSALERLSDGLHGGLEALQDGPTLKRILVGVLGVSSVGVGGYELGVRAGRAEAQAGPSMATAPSTLPAPPATQTLEKQPVEEPSREPATTPRAAPALAAAPALSAAEAKRQNDLEAEVSALRRIERVLRERNPRLALGLLQELDETVPRGKLLEERSAARTVALCELDDATSVANSRAAAFGARYRGSVYLPRVQKACGVEPPPAERIAAPAEIDPSK